MAEEIRRVAIYAHVPTDSQDTQNQLEQLRRYAEVHGWVSACEFIDQAESKGKANRPQFRRLFDAAARRELDVRLGIRPFQS